MNKKPRKGGFRKNLAGRKFGRLNVVERELSDRWHCLCDCGGRTVTRCSDLLKGNSRSCGCLRLEVLHGVIAFSRLPEYKSWFGMITRCENPNIPGFKYYGGRGIKVHPDWRNNFEAFLSHIGPRPTNGHSIDRIDNDGNYEPGNVRWATRLEQNNNTR